MNSENLAASFNVDEDMIKAALHTLEVATKSATDGHLMTLNKTGVLPTGVMNWLLACRVKL